MTNSIYFFKQNDEVFGVQNMEKCYNLPSGKYVSALVTDLGLSKDFISEKDVLTTLAKMLKQIKFWGNTAKLNMDLVNVDKLKSSELLLTASVDGITVGERYKQIPTDELSKLLML
ncbi:hypothetical protein [Photobacterium leiognathi]|uniref:hypothetical protein n=1 Tax=Photobacterium leiognathi TaxID=553611 RepID=UPI0029825B78|nr:hypothetical protein [Photobacterium leiognathi]